MSATFGLDFGTTNSLVSFVGHDPETNQVRAHVLTTDGMPHPSVVWYSGDGPVVGRRAKEQLSELGLGVFGDVVRSPKMFLGSKIGVSVAGTSRPATDVAAEVLKFLREDALGRGFRGNAFESAVMTIPVTMRGRARADLREAAARAGIHLHQFVHEPLAAFYGYLRAQPDFERQIADLSGRLVLVFDWGGGTLDLTLCSLNSGALTQVANTGDTGVGGDVFDLRLRRLVQQKHELKHPGVDWSRIQPSAEGRLIQSCEDAKISLSSRASTAVFVRDVLAVPGPAKDLQMELTRDELEGCVADLVAQGLSRIENVLELAGVRRADVEFCLATGGMVRMPGIQEGLREIFGVSRLHLVGNAATVIAEGAAWIAHDDLHLRLAKPIELLHADDTYVEIVPAGTELPVGSNALQFRMDMYCVDPSDGHAKFLLARPRWPGLDAHGDARLPYGHLALPVDRGSRPLWERLHVDVTIDHNLIADVKALSTMTGASKEMAIHDLEFGLELGGAM